jgi:hypothetical protein
MPKKIFWTTLPGVLTGIAALLGAITTLWLAFHDNRPPLPPKGPVKIASVTRKAPDCVEIQNITRDEVVIEGYRLGEKDKSFVFPKSTKLSAFTSIRVWFIRQGESMPSNASKQDLSSHMFRIKKGELITLSDNSGKLIHEIKVK